MDRRTVVRGGLGLAFGMGLAGCSGSTAPPPRQSKTFADVSVSGETLEIDLAQSPTVETRSASADAAQVALIGEAKAAKGGAKGAKGASGRGSGGYRSAPKGRHGWAVYYGGDYDDWHEEHRDEVTTTEADILTVGVAYLGSDTEYSTNPPGPGPVAWDQTWSKPADGKTIAVDLTQVGSGLAGWYRVGTELRAADGQLKAPWEAADFEVESATDGATIDTAWHVRPRL